MRYLRYVFVLALGVVLLTIAIANRATVTLNLLPDELAVFARWDPSITLPLFLVVFGGIVAGVAIGFVWEWMREHKHRAEAAAHRRERERLEREVDRLKPEDEKQTDDVLAILESGGAVR